MTLGEMTDADNILPAIQQTTRSVSGLIQKSGFESRITLKGLDALEEVCALWSQPTYKALINYDVFTSLQYYFQKYTTDHTHTTIMHDSYVNNKLDRADEASDIVNNV